MPNMQAYIRKWQGVALMPPINFFAITNIGG